MTMIAKHPPTATRKARVDGWFIAAMLIAAVVLLPLATILSQALAPEENIWPHLMATSLPRYFWNSFVLMISVGGFSVVLGVTTAWLVATRDFVGRRVFQWALLLPLSVPAYIGAYAFVDFFEYSGALQSGLRQLFGWESASEYWFPEVRSRGAAIWVLSLSLYPYVYLLALAAYRRQGAAMIEVARTLGQIPFSIFWRVGIPMARPAIVVGATIVMMETLADFGAVEFFAVQTLTTGIFTVWLEASNVGGAAQIALVILSLVMGLRWIEKRVRPGMATHQSARETRLQSRQATHGPTSLLIFAYCLAPVFFGFILPLLMILSHASGVLEAATDSSFLRAFGHTVFLAVSAAMLTLIAGAVLVYALRLSKTKWMQALVPLTMLGYATPGAVLALGLMIPLAAFDHLLADIVEATFGVNVGLLITGTAFAVILAYTVRFFAISFGALHAGLNQQSPNLDAAARALGAAPIEVAQRVHLPLLRTSILTAALLVFVDCSKELPATLLLRPFGFETMSTHVYAAASREDFASAASSALFIVLVGVAAVLVLARTQNPHKKAKNG